MDRAKLAQELRADEGEKFQAYKDTLGFVTVGVGHLVERGDHLGAGDRITPEQSEALLQTDITRALAACLHLFPAFATFPEEAQRVFANMAFNLGGAKLSHFASMLGAAKHRQWKIVAQAMRHSLWYTQVPHRAERLAKRIDALEE